MILRSVEAERTVREGVSMEESGLQASRVEKLTQRFVVWRKADIVDDALVPRQFMQQLPRRSVPHHDGPISGPRSDALSLCVPARAHQIPI